MPPLFALLLGLTLAWLVPGPAARADDDQYAAMCEQAIVNGARRGGVPSHVLHAIALTETGRKSNGRIRPYPWAINREGTGHWFKTREEAIAFARASLEAGRRSFDVGCVQINYRWHGHAFPTLEDMFDPEWTATYAAQFLRTLYEERGDWSEAAGAYHSLTPDLARIYRTRFDRLLAGLSPGDLPDVAPPAPQIASNGGVVSGRSAERAAARQAMIEQIRRERDLPPPDPVMGSVAAGRLLAPANGGLIVNGAGALLTEGSPLLSGPAGSLF